LDQQAKNSCASVGSSKSAKPLGGGVLVGLGHVATCSHVIDAVLKRPEATEEQPSEEMKVWVNFPFLDQGCWAQIVFWRPYKKNGEKDDDLTILKLEQPSIAAEGKIEKSLQTAACDLDIWGFHLRGKNGAPFYAKFSSAGPDKRIHLSGVDVGDGSFIEKGASGCGIFERDSPKLMGIVTSRFNLNDAREGLGIGIELINEAFSSLGAQNLSESSGDWTEFELDQDSQSRWTERYRNTLRQALGRLDAAAWSVLADCKIGWNRFWMASLAAIQMKCAPAFARLTIN